MTANRMAIDIPVASHVKGPYDSLSVETTIYRRMLFLPVVPLVGDGIKIAPHMITAPSLPIVSRTIASDGHWILTTETVLLDIEQTHHRIRETRHIWLSQYRGNLIEALARAGWRPAHMREMPTSAPLHNDA